MGRPATAILSRQLIGKTALDLIDRTGSFTMPELARVLGVRPSSLYNHVSGKSEVVELMRWTLGESISAVNAAEPWRDAVARTLRSYRESFAAHPAAIRILTANAVGEPRTFEVYESLAATLASIGVADDRTLEVIGAMDILALGAALDLCAPDDPWSMVEDAEHLARARATGTSGRERADRSFEFALSLLLDGIGAIARNSP